MNTTANPVVRRDFNATSFLWRFVASLVLVLATYNPTAYSYYGWLTTAFANGGLGPEHFVVGMLLLGGWAMLIIATRNSLGIGGFFVVAAVIGGIVWWLTDIGLVGVQSVSALTWVILFSLSLLLAIGLSWSHIWRRVTGQYEVDD
ncbi:MAG TPA: DUF6524 family protein, partial [Vicinamibacterales bacterium]|nr:DUF6524 family protein [Vicinamibacterales bacterium]